MVEIKKYSKVHRLGHSKNQDILKGGRVVITEKMDGCNFRLQLDDDKGMFLFGSRNVEFKEDGVPYPADSDKINRNFRKVCRWIEDNVPKEKVRRIEEEFGSKMTFFGENMVKHSLEYDWENIPIFLGFDIYLEDEDRYMGDFHDIKEVFRSLNLDTVEVVDSFDAVSPSELKDYEVPESKWREGQGEGVVIRNETIAGSGDYGSSSEWKAKMVTEEFEEKQQKTFGKKKKNLEDDTEKLVAQYCTEGRIEKHINKLVVDEDRELSMKLMEVLPMRIVEDIWEEEYSELVRTNYKFDMKKFRSRVAKRCVAKLKRRMQNEAINNG